MAPSQYRFLGISLKAWGILLLMYFVVIPLIIQYVPGALDFVARLGDPAGPAAHFDKLVVGWISRAGSLALATKVGQTLLAVFFAPGVYTVDQIWSGLLRQHSSAFGHSPWLDGVFGTLLFGLPFVFWYVVLATGLTRGFFYLGLWDPFMRARHDSRRWVLAGLVKLRETWDIVRHFGRRSTGGWAGFIQVLSNRFLAGDVFLGRPKLLLGGMLRPIGLPTQKHMVTIAGTGSGKSTAALIPNLCIHEGSLLCIDPKGELAAITARRRGPGGRGVSGMGQAVHVLDPFGIVEGWRSSAYNVFDEMERVASSDPGRAVSYASKVAEALVLKAEGGEQRYWDNAANTLLRGLILYIFAKEPKENRNLGRLRDLVVSGDIEGYQEALAAGDIRKEDGLSSFDVLEERMLACRSGPYGKVIAGTIDSIRKMGDRQMGGVVSTAQEHTSFLDEPNLQRISARSDFLIEDLRAGRTSVYVCLPLNMVSGKEGRWLRMFVLLFIDVMQRANKPLNPPVLLAVDEFPGLGRLEGIEKVAPTMRSCGVRFWAIGQDIEQFKSTYPDCWNGFISGAEAVQFMGVKDPETVQFLMDLLGEHVVRVRVPLGGGRSSWEKDERPLLDADQVARILSPDRKNQIIWRGNKKPMMLKTAPYFWYLPNSYYERDPRYGEPLRHRIWRGWLSRHPEPLGPVASEPPAVAETLPPAPPRVARAAAPPPPPPPPPIPPIPRATPAVMAPTPSSDLFMREIARFEAEAAKSAGAKEKAPVPLEKAFPPVTPPQPDVRTTAPPEKPFPPVTTPVNEEKVKEILSWTEEIEKTTGRKRGRPKNDGTEK